MHRLVVIGAQGQLGGCLVRAARDRGVEVIAAGRRPGADLLVDLEAPATWQPIFERRPDVVFVAAAYAAVDAAESEPTRAEQVNVVAPAELARQATARGARVVVFSSEYVFDGARGGYRETDTPAPRNVYGATKLAGERAVLAAGSHLVIRTSWLYGPDPGEKNFVFQVRAAAREGRVMRVPSDQIGCPTYHVDLARAVLELCGRGVSGIVHVAGPAAMSRAAFGRLVCDAFGLPPATIDPTPTAALGQRAVRPLRGELATERLAALLGRGLRAPRPCLDEMRRLE